MVERIVRLPPKLQPVTFPRHVEVLQQRHIDVPEAGSAEDVAVSDFTTKWVSELRTRRRWISEELNGSTRSIINLFLQGPTASGENCRAIENEARWERTSRSAKRQTAPSDKDARPCPTADELVDPTA